MPRDKQEYAAARDTQDALMDRMDGYEAAVLGLTEGLAKNHEMILENRRVIMENCALIIEKRELIFENRNAINDINRKIDSIMENINSIMDHLQVPKNPPAGFVKE